MSDSGYDKSKGFKSALKDLGELVASGALVGAVEVLSDQTASGPVIAAIGTALGLDPSLTLVLAMALGKIGMRLLNNWHKHRAPRLGQAALEEARRELRERERG